MVRASSMRALATPFLTALLLTSLCCPGIFGCRPHRPPIEKLRAAPNLGSKSVAVTHRGLGAIHLTKEQRGIVLARGEGFEVTAGFLADLLAVQPLALRVHYQNPENMKDFLRDVVAFEVLARMASDRGLARDPLVLHAYKRDLADRYLDEAAARAVRPSDISDADVASAYSSRPSLSTVPPMLHAYIMAGDDPVKMAKARKRLDEVAAEPDRVLARLVDMIPTHGSPGLGAGKTGDAGFIDASGMGKTAGRTVRKVPEVLANMMFKAGKIGADETPRGKPVVIVGPVATERGFIIGVVAQMRAEQRRRLNDVRQHIRNVLLAERRARERVTIRDRIVAKAHVRLNPAAIRSAFGIDPPRMSPGGGRLPGAGAPARPTYKLVVPWHTGRMPKFNRPRQEKIRKMLRKKLDIHTQGR